MQRPIHRRPVGFTVIEMMTVVLVIMVVMTLLLLGVTAARRSARRAECINNLRQLGLGIQQYDGRYRVMPSVHTNVWALVGDQLELPGIRADRPFANNDNDLISDLFRCPTDEFRLMSSQGCSYAPNSQVAPRDVATGPDSADEFNWRYSPWSTFKLDDLGNLVPCPNRFLRTQPLSQAASDTILLTEYWSSSNAIDVTAYRSTPFSAITGYLDPPAEARLGDAADARAYRSLAAFGAKANSLSVVYTVKNDVYHGGQISILFADLHAASNEVSNVTHRSPHQIPAWTYKED